MPRIALDEARGGMQGRLTRADAASYLGVSASTMADWHRKGIGPASVKVGGRRFYRVDALRAYIRQGS
jgi:DNA-binding transcriptional MerR regulator